MAALLVVVCVVCGIATYGSESEAGGQEPSNATRLAVLPTIDLAMGKANLDDIDTMIGWRLRAMGFDVIPEDQVDAFLSQHRIRYTGGASSSMLTALREELGAEAVLAASVELYEEEPPPRIGLSARVVSTLGPRIRWAGEITMAGEDRPGLIDSGMIDDVVELSDRAVARL